MSLNQETPINNEMLKTIKDLWSAIENGPIDTDLFFKLREQVRNVYEKVENETPNIFQGWDHT